MQKNSFSFSFVFRDRVPLCNLLDSLKVQFCGVQCLHFVVPFKFCCAHLVAMSADELFHGSNRLKAYKAWHRLVPVLWPCFICHVVFASCLGMLGHLTSGLHFVCFSRGHHKFLKPCLLPWISSCCCAVLLASGCFEVAHCYIVLGVGQ